jgi:hypothetical protein
MSRLRPESRRVERHRSGGGREGLDSRLPLKESRVTRRDHPRPDVSTESRIETLPKSVRAEVQRILDAEARRLLAERLEAEAEAKKQREGAAA